MAVSLLQLSLQPRDFLILASNLHFLPIHRTCQIVPLLIQFLDLRLDHLPFHTRFVYLLLRELQPPLRRASTCDPPPGRVFRGCP